MAYDLHLAHLIVLVKEVHMISQQINLCPQIRFADDKLLTPVRDLQFYQIINLWHLNLARDQTDILDSDAAAANLMSFLCIQAAIFKWWYAKYC